MHRLNLLFHPKKFHYNYRICVLYLIKYDQGRRNVSSAGGAEKKLRTMQTFEKQKIVTSYQARN